MPIAIDPARGNVLQQKDVGGWHGKINQNNTCPVAGANLAMRSFDTKSGPIPSWMTVDLATGKITVNEDGKYKIAADSGWHYNTGATALLYFRLVVTRLGLITSAWDRNYTNNSLANLALNGIVDLLAGDEVYVDYSSSNSTAPYIAGGTGNLTIERIAE